MSYDRAITVFSPNGELLQVQYASEAVSKGSCTLGVRGEDCVVLVCEQKAVPVLQVGRVQRKMLNLDDNIAVSFAGLGADARVLLNLVRDELQVYRLNFSDDPTPEWAARYIARIQQKYTSKGGRRPYGLSTLVAGFNNSGKPELYQTEPNGTYTAWKATAIGRNFKAPLDHLESKYSSNLDKLATQKLAIRSILQITEANVNNIEVFTVTKEGIVPMKNEELEPLLKELDDTEERMKKLKVEN